VSYDKNVRNMLSPLTDDELHEFRRKLMERGRKYFLLVSQMESISNFYNPCSPDYKIIYNEIQRVNGVIREFVYLVCDINELLES
jgi:hypothetical protein